ncbi:hypothetical protein Fot_04805 [Forsythia ovata]|uniref:Uncharacterized protein n=1 Tax=Forsythia ovata TaxID=205694 RepID=A0ABD1WNC4_9LAMI
MENECENARVNGQLENDGNVDGVPKGAYVPEFSENVYCNIEVEWEVFLDRHQEDIWNIWKDGLGMNNEKKTQPTGESVEDEVQTEEFQKGFVDSNFEYKEEHIPTQNPQPSDVNMNLGMDDMASQQGNADDTDYDDSGELQSLCSNGSSTQDLETTKIKHAMCKDD